MAAPIELREDFDALALRGLAKKTRDANQTRRLLAIAEIYDGGSRGDGARTSLGAHRAVTDRRERAFDDIRCAQMLPLLGREVVEGEQRFS